MVITVNGIKREFLGATSLGALLAELGLSEKPVVVELNQTALLPREMAQAEIRAGDVIEIVQITAGG